MEKLLVIIFSVILINNFVLARFLGLCPFLGVSREFKSSLSMGAAVIFVMTLASTCTWFIHRYLLIPYRVEFVEMVIQRVSPLLQKALGIYLPLITTNCAVLGVCLLNIKEGYGLLETIVHGAGAGVGFTLAILIMSGIRERLVLGRVPSCMQGFPISFIIAA
jgi:electron transport complex protein RnfA